jgi:anaerobic selenocysteine-containing dehydrogenase
VQWGGRILCRDGEFPTPDGKARFIAAAPPERSLPEGSFLLSTRRGKQFNSMIHREKDPLTGARRHDVLISAEDASSVGVRDGEEVLLRSEVGEFLGRAKVAPLRPGNVQVHWPESQRLIRRGVRDPECGIPDFNAVVEITRAGAR